MKIFIDVFSGDEMFSDTYKISLKEGVLWEVIGKYETRTDGEIVLAGSNASAEEEAEGTDANSVSGIDIVLNHNLVETGFGKKKDFMGYLKEYMKKVIAHLEENDRKEEVAEFKTNINTVMKDLIGQFDDLQFFNGESMDPDAMVAMCQYKDMGDGKEVPVMMFFKHGLREEKC